MIRTPVISYAFEKYRSNWYQIDAPRHFFIYSINAMKMVIDKTGLRLKDIYFDSTEDQFTWSERYSNNIAMQEVTGSPIETILRKLLSKYRKRAIELNRDRKGDQAVFYITTTDNDN